MIAKYFKGSGLLLGAAGSNLILVNCGNQFSGAVMMIRMEMSQPRNV